MLSQLICGVLARALCPTNLKIVTLVLALAFGLHAQESLAQSQDDTAAPLEMKALCMPADQQACSCDMFKFQGKNLLVKPCFQVDLNRAEANQTDRFGNNAFAGLNWPKGGARGVPNYATFPPDAAVDGDYVTVWDSWPSSHELFPGKGKLPEPWGKAQAIVPDACLALDLAAEKAKHADALVPKDSPVRVLNDFVNPDGDVLVDASGQPVRYDVAFNMQAYGYVYENQFYDREVLKKYLAQNDAVSFPMGVWANENRGSIVIKAAWKILDTARDNPKHFHKSWAYIWPVIENGVVQKDKCEVQPVALIAMHIAVKSRAFPEWLWITFEHLAVAPTWHQFYDVESLGALPDYGDPLSAQPGNTAMDDWLFTPKRDLECRTNCPSYSALNAGEGITNGTVPTLPSRLVAEHPRGFNFNTPSEAAAGDLQDDGHDPELDTYAGMDATMRQGFKGTVLTYYRLKGVQWATSLTKMKVPEILANTVLEAFSQSTSSCMGCHAESGTTKTRAGKHPFDFIFALGQCGTDTTAETDESCLR